jgi:hypothetical protein
MAETVEIDTREAGGERRDNVTSAGLEPSTWNELEQWRDREQITSRSEATRRLIRAGLDDLNPTDDGVKLSDQLITALATLFVIGYPVGAAAVGETRLAVGYVASVTLLSFFEPWLSAAWNRAKDALPNAPFS